MEFLCHFDFSFSPIADFEQFENPRSARSLMTADARVAWVQCGLKLLHFISTDSTWGDFMLSSRDQTLTRERRFSLQDQEIDQVPLIHPILVEGEGMKKTS
jgi:hypothetical protein